MNRNRSSEKTGYKIILILLIALAALSNAMKDLNRLQELSSSLQEFTSEWLGDGLITANAKDNSLGANSCSYEATAPVNSTDEFHWNGRVAPGKAIEIKGLNGDIKAEPAAGSDIEVIANKKGHRSDPSVVKIQVVEHPDGVTIWFNGEISSDFPLTLLGNFSRKHVSGRIGNGGRELILKTLNGSINLRRAS